MTKVYRSMQSAALILGSLLFLFKVPDNPFVAFALTGSFVPFAASNRAWRSRLTLFLVSIGYWTLFRRWGPPVDPYQGWWIAYPGGFLGLAAGGLMMLPWFWTDGKQETTKRYVVLQASIPAVCAVSTIFVSSRCA